MFATRSDGGAESVAAEPLDLSTAAAFDLTEVRVGEARP